MQKRKWPRYSMIGAVLLVGCAPPNPHIISQCRLAATREAQGRSVDASDVGELIEACMMEKGFAVRESGPTCSDDAKGPLDPACYYPNTLPSRVAEWVRSVL